MTESELNSIYEEFYLRNPNKGHVMDSKNFLDKLPNQEKHNYIIFPPWFTKEEFDVVLTIKQAKRYLSTMNLTFQNYYDIVVLGLRKIDERPHCECGNPCKFKTFSLGYDKYCCREHSSKYKETPIAFIEAGRKSKLGRKTPDSVKKKISESEKKTKAGKIYICTPETSAKLSRAKKGKPKSKEWRQHMRESALRRIKENPDKALANLRNGGYRSGKISYYTCVKAGNKVIKCLSSWEEHFLRLCDRLNYIVQVDTCQALKYLDPITKQTRLYIPDFLVTLDTGARMMIEIKPVEFKYDPVVLAKKCAAIKYCKSNNIIYVTLTERELFLKSGKYFNLFDFHI